MATKKNMNESANGANNAKFENKPAKDAKQDAKRKATQDAALANVAGCDKIRKGIETAKQRNEVVKQANETARNAAKEIRTMTQSVSGCVRTIFAAAEKNETMDGENVRSLLKMYAGSNAVSKRKFMDAYGSHIYEVLKIGQIEVRTHKTGKHAGETYEYTHVCTPYAVVRMMREEVAAFLRYHE